MRKRVGDEPVDYYGNLNMASNYHLFLQWSVKSVADVHRRKERYILIRSKDRNDVEVGLGRLRALKHRKPPETTRNQPRPHLYLTSILTFYAYIPHLAPKVTQSLFQRSLQIAYVIRCHVQIPMCFWVTTSQRHLTPHSSNGMLCYFWSTVKSKTSVSQRCRSLLHRLLCFANVPQWSKIMCFQTRFVALAKAKPSFSKKGCSRWGGSTC